MFPAAAQVGNTHDTYRQSIMQPKGNGTNFCYTNSMEQTIPSARPSIYSRLFPVYHGFQPTVSYGCIIQDRKNCTEETHWASKTNCKCDLKSSNSSLSECLIHSHQDSRCNMHPISTITHYVTDKTQTVSNVIKFSTYILGSNYQLTEFKDISRANI